MNALAVVMHSEAKVTIIEISVFQVSEEAVENCLARVSLRFSIQNFVTKVTFDLFVWGCHIEVILITGIKCTKYFTDWCYAFI